MNGDRVACHGLARDIGIRIADELSTTNCYSIPVDTYDMVLDVTSCVPSAPSYGTSMIFTWPFGRRAARCFGAALVPHTMTCS